MKTHRVPFGSLNENDEFMARGLRYRKVLPDAGFNAVWVKKDSPARFSDEQIVTPMQPEQKKGK